MTFFLNKNTFQPLAITITILLYFTSSFYAQELSVRISDSLKNKSSQELAQVIKVSKRGEAAFYEQIVLDLKEKNRTAVLYKELGKRFSKEENYDKAHHYLDIALSIAKRKDNRESVCVISILKARAYMLNGENESAISFYTIAIDLAKKHKYIRLEIIATSGYMSLLSQMDDRLEKALEMAKALLVMLDQPSYRSYRNTGNHVQTLTMINDVFLGAEQYDNVLLYADKGIKIADSIGYSKGLTDLFVKKGIAHYYKNSNEQSRVFLAKAKSLIDENVLENDFHQKVRVNYFLAKLKYDQNSYNEAIDYLTTIVSDIKDEDTNKLPIIQTYYLLMYCHRKLDNDEKAWEYHDVYMTLQEAYQKNENKTRNRIFERERKLESEKERQRTHLEKTYKEYTQIGLITVLVVLIILGYNFLRKQKKNKKLFNDLIYQIDQLESQNQNKELQEKKKNSAEISIDDDKVRAVLKGLAKLEKQEYFLRPDCNLRAIAKKTKTNATYLSKIINTHKGKKFNEYMNDLRIDYALRRLKEDRRFRSFSIKSIALEVGYKSDKSFAKHFKSKTGINPSYYIKNLENV